jgi:hypothetical protein
MTTDPTRLVADADVLAADLLVGASSREALDTVRAHSWLTLVATEQLLADAEAVITSLADAELAAAWRERVSADATVVEQPAGDHPAIAAAYHGDAGQLLTFDDSLTSADAGLALKPHLDVSVRTPEAFCAVFDPGPLYEATVGDSYPGPDRDPRD